MNKMKCIPSLAVNGITLAIFNKCINESESLSVFKVCGLKYSKNTTRRLIQKLDLKRKKKGSLFIQLTHGKVLFYVTIIIL